MSKERLRSVGTLFLVFCALVSTALVLERRFAPSQQPQRIVAEPVFVENWRDALAIGLRAGSATAPVQVIEFGDFECPYCAKFESTVTRLRQAYPESVAVTFVHYPLPQHSASREAAAAECANEQGRFDEMKAVLFDNFHNLASVNWESLASRAQVVNVQTFYDCIRDAKTLDRVDQSKKLAKSMGVAATPEIIVNGWMLPLTPTLEDF